MLEVSTGKAAGLVKAVALCTLALALGCSSGNQGGGTSGSLSVTETINYTTTPNTEVDLLFVLDNRSSTTDIKTKLYDQIPLFMSVLQNLPNPLDLHIAVVTPDMGAPGDVTATLQCTTMGDDGAFRSAPTGTCTNSGLAAGATFLTDANGVANFTGPLATALQCISMVGDNGCGFGQPLAALDRALGADGQQPPSTNANFLRPEAYLAIVLLANDDDCSAPANTELFSLDGGQQNLANPLGPISRYRCSQFGHLCTDASGQIIMPPLNPPSDAQGTAAAPTLDLTDCTSNDTGSGLLTPVSQFVADIKALKADPDNQIVVAAIAGPPSPYAVQWLPAEGGQNTQPGELWPQVELSCGPAGSSNVNPEATMNPTDGSAGAPGVRIAQFVKGFSNSLLASVCDASYASAMQVIATKVGALPTPPCLTGSIQLNAEGLPDCAVTAHLVDASGNRVDASYQNCDANGNTTPCWSLGSSSTTCAGQLLNVTEVPGSTSRSVTVTCSLCEPGVSAPGC